jgi:hypothetical protein
MSGIGNQAEHRRETAPGGAISGFRDDAMPGEVKDSYE